MVEVLLRAMTSLDMLLVVIGIAVGLLRNEQSTPPARRAAHHFRRRRVRRHERAAFRWNQEPAGAPFPAHAFQGSVFRHCGPDCDLAPQLLIFANVKKPVSLIRFAPSQVIWPWAASARLMLHDAPLVSMLTAAAWVSAALLFGRMQFERMLRSDNGAAKKKERDAAPDSFTERIFRLPARFFGDPLAALMEKELRTLSAASPVFAWPTGCPVFSAS